VPDLLLFSIEKVSMDKINFYKNDSEQNLSGQPVKGCYVELDGEKFYKIENYHLMPPFFMSIVSHSDHWLFISSNGALTAGRKDPDHALFPYYNDDQITDLQDTTGNKSIIFVRKNEKNLLWEPFSKRCQGLYRISRNIYKNVYGNKLIFEEVNQDLEITFAYGWFLSHAYGFIKRSKIQNSGKDKAAITLLDGIQNILPYGIDRTFQIQFSTLSNAYKKNELLADSGIGIYYLSSIPTDKAEPSEGLKATVVWSLGLKHSLKLISSDQIELFRKQVRIVQETDVKACRGAYLINTSFELAPGGQEQWYLIADINKDSADIIALEKQITTNKDLAVQLETEIKRDTDNLVKIVAQADGLEATADELISSRHFSNVLFNIMRGGIFSNQYQIEKNDFLAHLSQTNKKLAGSCKNFLKNLPDSCSYRVLVEKAQETGNPDLERLAYEYLPLTFSRRHGDPSRPWNLFSIQVRNEDGSQILYYQGNWRDIFQNWEALAVSFPEFVESMIAKFVNACTADGYNPYRLTRYGIDWEVLDPQNPWSHIGYWGDHQIIYLLKLLEISNRYHPGKLHNLLARNIFTYTNIPYRIKTYQELLKDPHNTIDFDLSLEDEIKKQEKQLGSDAKLLKDNKGEIYKVNLAEKLLVLVLAKLANFIPEAGIWLNTQRPEWNDANNALVGYGVSMVTLCYLRRMLKFCLELFTKVGFKNIEISAEVKDLLDALSQILQTHKGLLKGKISDADRKRILDLLGRAASNYRTSIYKNGFSLGKAEAALSQIKLFFSMALEYCDHCLRANKRGDNLYHSYNLMKVVNNEGIAVRNLTEMLEGQVAVLSSGFLTSEKAIAVLDALRASKMYRPDQNSYLLYPNRELPPFMQKNNIPKEMISKSKLLKRLIDDGNSQIIRQDCSGGLHFNGTFRNALELEQALKNLTDLKYKELAAKEQELILEIFEQVFDHQSFTGRSGTFYGYEGLGCIYWHMVSKLVLATQENYYRALNCKAKKEILDKLTGHYYAIRAGLGHNKSPEVYGAFPTDPYSHTPANKGAKQPGMTGQVKEDILCRWGELGLQVEEGQIKFHPGLLRGSEFGKAESTFSFFDINCTPQEIKLKENCLGFTYCQVPVVCHQSRQEKIEVTFKDGKVKIVNALLLDKETSASIFSREGKVVRLDVYLEPASY
jgi:hypothetical protein